MNATCPNEEVGKAEEQTAIQRVSASPVWHWFGRNFTYPKYTNIAMNGFADRGQFAPAHLVLEHLHVDLAALSQIFVDEPWEYYSMPQGARPRQPIAESYVALGVCRAWDDDGWKALAMLTGKTIHFVHCHGEPMGAIRSTYYPDGRIKIRDRNT